MKKITLVLAFLLIAGCCALLPLGGAKDEIELVPKTANIVVILRPSALINDSDFSSIYDSNGGMTSQITKFEDTSGIDPAKIDRVVFFSSINSFQHADFSYGAFIMRGTMDKDKILTNMRTDNSVTETSYGGQTLYELTPNDTPENKSYYCFLDANTLLGGTKKAVQDSIDTNAGKMNSVKTRQNLSSIYDSFDKNSLAILLMDISSGMKNDISGSIPEQLNATSLSHMNSLGVSVAREASDINFTVMMVAENAHSASDLSTFFGNTASLLKGVVKSGSTEETFLNDLNIKKKGDAVTLSLLTTSYDFQNLRDEMQQPQ
jgi:hypothetical protein